MVEKQTVINRRIFFDDTGKELDFDGIRVDDLKDNGVVHVNTSGSDGRGTVHERYNGCKED